MRTQVGKRNFAPVGSFGRLAKAGCASKWSVHDRRDGDDSGSETKLDAEVGDGSSHCDGSHVDKWLGIVKLI